MTTEPNTKRREMQREMFSINDRLGALKLDGPFGPSDYPDTPEVAELLRRRREILDTMPKKVD